MIVHRINRCNTQAITDGTIGGAAAALDHDIVFTTEIDDVPDNQKISGETQFGYEREFFLDLTFYFCTDSGVTLLRTEPDDCAQKRIHRVTCRHWIFGKLISQILQ